MYQFEYCRARDLAHATALLSEAAESRPVAGGMSLVPAMKHRLAAPSRLVDLNGLGELSFVADGASAVVVGAMTRHETVAENHAVRARIPALAALAGGIGDVQVRHRGTIGGSIANNDPGACYPSALLALDAVVHTTRRTIPADDFFLGMFETALEPAELITKVEFPVPEAAAYIKFHNLASRFSIVGVFVARFAEGTRVAVTGAASCVFRAAELEARLSERFSPDAVRDVRIPHDDFVSDVHGSAEYRAHLVPVLAGRAVEQCLDARP